MLRSYLIIIGIIGLLTNLTSCKKDKKNESSIYAPTLVNHAYGNDPAQVMDIYLPTERSHETTKVIIIIPGKDWMSGSKEEVKTMINLFRNNYPNYAYFTLNYRLFDSITNENKFPSQEEDIELAVNYIKSNRLNFRVSDKVAILGENAGAHLALLQAYKHNSDHFIKAVAAISPLSNLQDSLTNFPATKSLIEQLFGGTMTDFPIEYKDASPIEFVQSAIPTTIFHRKLNTQFPYEQSVILRDTLSNLGIPTEIKLYEGAPSEIQPHIKSQIINQISTFFNTYNP